MHKSIYTLVWLTIICFTTKAQELTFSTHHIVFNTVNKPSADSIKLSLTFNAANGLNQLTVTDINTYNPAFTVSDTAFTILQGATKDIWVKFAPIHNIRVASQICIYSNASNSSECISISGTGSYNEPYYANTQNLSEQALKDALKTIISTGQASCTYNSARDQMFMILDNKKTNGQGATTNTLECVYTGRESVGYTSRSASQTNDNFNTEHTWPQSLFSSNTPMVCDLHHLFPTDETANGKRSNYPFGMVTTPSWANGGSKYANSVFEPRDEHKGEVARAMMYFVLRYQDYSTFFAPQENIFRIWHPQFTPSAIEIKRNDDIYSYQGNRNPFIDHPEFLDRITLLAANSVAPSHMVVCVIKSSSKKK
jgi:endonuclease I